MDGCDASVSKADGIYNRILDEIIVCCVSEVRRFDKLQLDFLWQDEDSSDFGSVGDSPSKEQRSSSRKCSPRRHSEDFQVHEGADIDVFGNSFASVQKMVNSQQCKCPQCGRSMVATRFAPHLARCMGMGRNSSRVANRRLQDQQAMERDLMTSYNDTNEQLTNGAENESPATPLRSSRPRRVNNTSVKYQEANLEDEDEDSLDFDLVGQKTAALLTSSSSSEKRAASVNHKYS